MQQGRNRTVGQNGMRFLLTFINCPVRSCSRVNMKLGKRELQPLAILILAHSTPRFYPAAVEKNREKAWDQNYVTKRKWWTPLVQTESTISAP